MPFAITTQSRVDHFELLCSLTEHDTLCAMCGSTLQGLYAVTSVHGTAVRVCDESCKDWLVETWESRLPLTQQHIESKVCRAIVTLCTWLEGIAVSYATFKHKIVQRFTLRAPVIVVKGYAKIWNSTYTLALQTRG